MPIYLRTWQPGARSDEKRKMSRLGLGQCLPKLFWVKGAMSGSSAGAVNLDLGPIRIQHGHAPTKLGLSPISPPKSLSLRPGSAAMPV